MPIITPNEANNLTVKQHIFPLAAIQRFSNTEGNINIHNIRAKKTSFNEPNAKNIRSLFIAKKAWDQRVEQGYMQEVEKEYQAICDNILSDSDPIRFDIKKKQHQDVITKFVALWDSRYKLGNNPVKNQEIIGVNDVAYLPPKDDRIELEKSGITSVIKEDNTFYYPSDAVTGVQIQMSVMRSIDYPCNWGIIESENDNQFIVPDQPCDGIIPFSPNLAFKMNSKNSMISLEDLKTYNSLCKEISNKYYFAQDLLKCPSNN